MKQILLFMAFLSVSLSAVAQKEFTGEGDGYSWIDPNNWSDNSVPEQGDDIYISGFSVYIDYSDVVYGTLNLSYAHLATQSSIMLSGDLYVDAGSTIDVIVTQFNQYNEIYCESYYFNGTLSMQFTGYAPRIGDTLEIIHGLQGSCGTQTVVYIPEAQASGMEVTFGVQCHTYGINYIVTDINYASAIAWDGEGGDRNWTTAANWDPNGVPTAEDYVYINHPGAANYVNTSGGGVTVAKGIIIGRDNTLAINGDLLVDSHIENNIDGTVLWNAGIIMKSEDDFQSILFNYGDLILDSPGLKSLENDFEIWAFEGNINHNQGNLNINNGRIRIYNDVNYNINGDNITIGYSSGTNHYLMNRGNKAIKKTSGTGTSSINLTNLENGGDIICEEGTLVIGEGLIENVNSNFGGSGALQFPPGFVLDKEISPGSSPGILTIAGDLTTNTNATFNIEIDGPVVGTDYDRLVIENNADINANLNIILGYLPPNDAVFQIVSAGTMTVNNLPETIDTEYNGTTVTFNVIVQDNSIYLLKPGATLSTPSVNAEELQIYPNPVKDVLTIKLPQNENGSWTLINQLGQIVLEGKLEITETKINSQNLISGIYALHLKDKNNNTLNVSKIIKE